MAKDSIFAYIAQLEIKEEFDALKARPVFEKETIVDPSDDLADMIKQEIEKREGNISNTERAFALRYLTRDFRKSQLSAHNYYDLLTDSEPSNKEYKMNLDAAYNFLLRSEQDAMLAQMLMPGFDGLMPTIPYEKITDLIDAFKQRLYFASEFPSVHNELANLNESLQIVIARENYGYAAQFRDRMAKAIENSQKR